MYYTTSVHVAVMTEYAVLRTDPHYIYIYNILNEYNMWLYVNYKTIYKKLTYLVASDSW